MTSASVPPKAVEVFFSYAHEDEKLRDELAKQLKLLKRQGLITDWNDRDGVGLDLHFQSRLARDVTQRFAERNLIQRDRDSRIRWINRRR